MAQGSRIASGSILIVDDERSILDILAQFLEDRGYRVVTAKGAEEALQLVGSERFDVALIDLKLPDRAGIELLDPFHRADPVMKCVIMTAFASLESTIEAVRFGAFDYVLKPFDLIRIGEIVDAAAENAALGRESEHVRSRLEEANRKLAADTEALDRELLRINGELSRVNESLNRHVTRLRVLYQMGRDISSNENWSDALDRFLMALRTYLEADGTGLLLFSNNEESLKARASYQLETPYIEEAIGQLSTAHQNDTLQSEMFSLESCSGGRVTACLGMTSPWAGTVAPLIYKGRWLGFLVVRKEYRSRRAYLRDYHFLNTIQTILTEEVANAANISRLRNLKDFNETVLERMNSGVLTTDSSGRVSFLNERAREIIGAGGGAALLFDELFANPFGRGRLFARLMAGETGHSSLA